MSVDFGGFFETAEQKEHDEFIRFQAKEQKEHDQIIELKAENRLLKKKKPTKIVHVHQGILAAAAAAATSKFIDSQHDNASDRRAENDQNHPRRKRRDSWF